MRLPRRAGHMCVAALRTLPPPSNVLATLPAGTPMPQAELLVADATTTLTVSGNGDVLEPHDGVMAIGQLLAYSATSRWRENALCCRCYRSGKARCCTASWLFAMLLPELINRWLLAIVILLAGSGGGFAVAAARALVDVPSMEAEAIAQKAMTIAASMCVYTNSNFITEVLAMEKETK